MHPLLFLWAHRQRTACPAESYLLSTGELPLTPPLMQVSSGAGQASGGRSHLRFTMGALKQGGQSVAGLRLPGRTCDTQARP